MGVFARLLRRSKATEEASTAAAQDDTPTAQSAQSEAVAVAEESAEVKESAEAAQAKNEADGDTSGEGVEIPQQQSAEEAADSEAGEGART
ncbi:hypothetical protein ABZZ74_38370 [Streptomyces sp. NPDC006476]|uniref:hypothetical protein n=1 Tax=Streptomyces sp. NPDC006476 TaxID=3157175 RepID=UPI0033B8700F